MVSFQKTIIIYLLAINVLAYILMCFDKFQSKKNGNRISENKLFMFALLLGAFGIYSGMKYPMYHKAAKSKFKIGIPFLLLLNLICIYCFFKYL
jgi:uncharacterized membrane protein YsdA (DUF1294 family)